MIKITSRCRGITGATEPFLAKTDAALIVLDLHLGQRVMNLTVSETSLHVVAAYDGSLDIARTWDYRFEGSTGELRPLIDRVLQVLPDLISRDADLLRSRPDRGQVTVTELSYSAQPILA